jgi:predicted Zn-dependent protease
MSGASITPAMVKELEGVAAQVAELATRAGADGAEVLVRDGSELTTKIRLGEPELVQEAGSRALGLRVFKNGRRAVTYTSDLRKRSLESFVAETVALADLAEPDEFGGLPDTADLAKNIPDLDLYDDAVAEVDAAWALRQCIAGEKAARGADARVTNSEGATWSRVLGATAYATSNGFVGGYRGSYASLVVEPICDDESDPENPKKRNGYWWTANRFLAALQDAEAVGREATRRTVATLGSRKIETQECPIVFDPEVGRSLIARKLGRASTGSAGRGVGGNPGPTTTNLIMQPGAISKADLLKQTPRGLYVTSMMGFGFNAVTGDFSRGAQGFWIENGELTFPVSEITVSANFDDLLKRIDLVADDLDLRSSTACPTYRVSHRTIAGT